MAKLPSFLNLDGTITTIRLNGGAVTDTITRDVAENITYDASFLNNGTLSTVSDMTPCNRRFSKARMITAKVGDMCTIRMNRRNGESCLYVLTERDDLYDCNLNPIEVL